MKRFPSPSPLRNARILFLALTLPWLAPAVARAAPVTITPTSVVLTPGNATALVTIVNEGNDSTRFETTMNSWSESADGTTLLQGSDDIIVFPQLITLQPHETRKIRIGTELATTPSERSYRLILQELPQLNPQTGQVQIQVLAKISLPIFVTPRGAQPKAVIDAPKLQDGILTFDVMNGGTSHFVLHQVEVRGVGAAGDTFSHTANGWYVLAAGRRTFHLALAAPDCRQTTDIVIKAISDTAPVETRVPVSSGTCGNGRESRFLKADGSPASAS